MSLEYAPKKVGHYFEAWGNGKNFTEDDVFAVTNTIKSNLKLEPIYC